MLTGKMMWRYFGEFLVSLTAGTHNKWAQITHVNTCYCTCATWKLSQHVQTPEHRQEESRKREMLEHLLAMAFFCNGIDVIF
jgi:2-keto-3-deoxy-galactonokinase